MFDAMGTVIDWLDYCRSRQIGQLLNLYDQAATLHCHCTQRVLHGRAEIEHYWRPRLGASVPSSFVLDDIAPDGDGIVLDYQSFEGKPVRVRFRFNTDGKIAHTACGPRACTKAA